MRAQTFHALIEPRSRGGVAIRIPFDPAAEWGDRDRFYIAGTIEGRGVRGVLTDVDGVPYLLLGPTWCRDPEVAAGNEATVVLAPEGPQMDTVSSDIADALDAEPKARRLFESLATFYRKGFVDWIEDAKKPETRASRITEAVAALKDGRRER